MPKITFEVSEELSQRLAQVGKQLDFNFKPILLSYAIPCIRTLIGWL